MVVSNIFYFHPYLGKWSNLINIFQVGWNHQLVVFFLYTSFSELRCLFVCGPSIGVFSQEQRHLCDAWPGDERNLGWTWILLMEEILHHLGCRKPCKYLDIHGYSPYQLVSRNSSINSMVGDLTTMDHTVSLIHRDDWVFTNHARESVRRQTPNLFAFQIGFCSEFYILVLQVFVYFCGERLLLCKKHHEIMDESKQDWGWTYDQVKHRKWPSHTRETLFH